MQVSWEDLSKQNINFDVDQVSKCINETLVEYVGDISFEEINSSFCKEDICSGITGSLINRFGAWISGWNWAANEPGGGGPIQNWCCETHSLFRLEDVGISDTVIRIKDAVEEWHQYILFLHDLFEELDQSLSGESIDVHFEKSAVKILNHILQQTDATDAWYNTFQTVLGWYLEYHGMLNEKISEKIDTLVSGKFESWIAPEEETSNEVCKSIGIIVNSTNTQFGKKVVLPLDAIALWKLSRQKMLEFFSKYPAKVKFIARNDNHKKLILTYDASRSLQRSEKLLRVLELARALAKNKSQLNWENLCEWQSILLGRKVEFRTADAFAKQGNEKYRYSEYTEDEFKKLLKEVNDDSVDALLKAALVYQDIIFYHPFEDGNSRLARIVLEYVLFKEKLGIILPEPLFLMPRYPDPYGFYYTLKAVVGLKRF